MLRFGFTSVGNGMTTNKTYRASLIEELCDFSDKGVKLYLDGKTIHSERHLADLILAEKNCTYMRNYHFEDGKITEIEFDKIKI